MSNGTFREQMGAMALVDELRLQQRQMQEHLDLPRRREEVAERIRGYYQRQGIACDDALIEQGVHEFFARRLVFEAPALSWPRRLLAGLLLRRALIAWLLVGVALLGGTLLATKQRPSPAPSQPSKASVANANNGLAVPAPQWSSKAERAAYQARLEQYTQLMARIEAMPLSSDTRARLIPYALSTGPVVTNHPPAASSKALRELQLFTDFVESKLQLVIPDGTDEVSGYERCLMGDTCRRGSKDGKAWFLVFQGHDPQGRVVTMPVLSNGLTTFTDTVGVQVSRAQYLKSRKSKRTTGHIDKPIFGKKDAYSLGRGFDARIIPGGRFDNPSEDPQSITARF
ncbi:DUF6384 family protein [Pseudomonas guariconensis]|uniref:DUF6384 family protein n=2 Tax=Pseudomonas guariconensis TaxID=1288410 RepID=UPI0038711B41